MASEAEQSPTSPFGEDAPGDPIDAQASDLQWLLKLREGAPSSNWKHFHCVSFIVSLMIIAALSDW